MNDRMWWYEREGQQAGPVPQAEILELVRSGRLDPGARVWRDGLPSWTPLRLVPELASAIPSPTVPLPTGSPPSGPPPGGPGSFATSSGRLEAVSPGATVALGFVTLGIYPIVRFYQAALAYEALALRRSRFVAFFWLAVGLFLAGFPLHLVPLGGVPAHLASLVFTVLALFEVLEVRGEAVKRLPTKPVLVSPGTHQALFIASLLTAFLLIGFVLIAVETYKFFEDHDAIVAAVARPSPA
jgi:hypothetical protein